MYSISCRVCLINCSDDDLALTVFDQSMETKLTIAEMLQEMFGYQIDDHDDELPKSICQQCWNDIVNSYELKTRLFTMEKVMRNYYTEIKTQSVEELEEAEEHIVSEFKAEPVEFEEVPPDSPYYEMIEVDIQKKEEQEFCDAEELFDVMEQEEGDNEHDENEGIVIRKSSKINSSRSEYWCNKCDPPQKLSQRGYKMHHNFHIIQSKNPYLCITCSYTFNSMDPSIGLKMKKHFVAHRQGKNIPCRQCSPIELFESKNQLKVHENWQHKNGQNPFQCKNNTCLKVFQTITALQRHVDEETEGACMVPENDPQWKCYICDVPFMMRITKLKHVQMVHADINDADCPHCIRRFHSAKAFENHLKEHQMTPQFLCGTCGKEFHRRAFLTEHVKTHDPNYRFICDYCGFSSGRKVKLMDHIKLHSSEKKHGCITCSKRFLDAETLRSHRFAVHKIAERKYYSCEKCQYAYFYRLGYERHLVHCDGSSNNPVRTTRIRLGDVKSKF